MGGRAGGGASAGMGSRSRSETSLAQAQRDKVIGILKENRDSVISQIKYEYRGELKSGKKTLKDIMNQAVDYAVKIPYYTSQPNRMKTNLRKMIHDMWQNDFRKMEKALNKQIYGVENPTLSQLSAWYHSKHP
jgi:isochorismate hydrolase